MNIDRVLRNRNTNPVPTGVNVAFGNWNHVYMQSGNPSFGEFSYPQPNLVVAPVKVEHIQSEDTFEPTESESYYVLPTESYFKTTLQILVPFIIGGLGLIAAGLVMDQVQYWEVFKVVTTLTILIPTLLGLKGNLEMTLASRLSTHANLGHLDNTHDMWYMILGNLCLVQCQALIVAFFAAIVAILLGIIIPPHELNISKIIIVLVSSLITASLASFFLGVVTSGVIAFSRKWGINPDNVAAPIAASLGDLCSLSILAWIATIVYENMSDYWWVCIFILIFYCITLPMWVAVASNNIYTRNVLIHGWTPIVAAMLISSAGGLILDMVMSEYDGVGLYQPLLNGVGGNLGAVLASRISTTLFSQSRLGQLPTSPDSENRFVWAGLRTTFCGKSPDAKTTRVLLALVIPGHLLFLYTASWISKTHISFLFISVFMICALIQITAILYMTRILVHLMFKHAMDPDNSAIPFITAVADLFGISFLGFGFKILHWVQDPIAM